MIFDRQLTNRGHTYRLLVTQAIAGWDIKEEQDSVVVHVGHHDDWHRVERALRVFELKALATGESESRRSEPARP